ncbi:hypothetical protein PMAC_000550 [Pneumocystis sp. 'macacae']|nr:hypothetical protein PMAC_000550 [Pneumocystis sp. 'macacae']
MKKDLKVIVPKIGSATSLYRQLLIHIGFFFDRSSRIYLRKHIRERFDANREQKCPQRIKKAFQDGHKALVGLKKAIAGDIRSCEKILELTYGRRGRRKHELLRPLLTSLRTGTPMVPGRPRTKLPVLSAQFQMLIESQMPGRTIFLENTTLDRRRYANLCWRKFVAIYLKILAPLPIKEIKLLERLCRGEEAISMDQSFRKLRSEPPNSADPHYITPRFQRRLYQRLLMKCPLLFWDYDQGWVVKWSKEAPNKNMRANLIHDEMFLTDEKDIKTNFQEKK